jgi:hypothetical protein
MISLVSHVTSARVVVPRMIILLVLLCLRARCMLRIVCSLPALLRLLSIARRPVLLLCLLLLRKHLVLFRFLLEVVICL